MSKKESIIGIQGAAGKLGRRWKWQAALSGNVLCYDIAEPNSENGIIGIDPNVQATEELAGRIEWTSSINELMRRSTRVIWCAPLDTISGLDELDGALDLQSSTMALSHHKKAQIQSEGQFAGAINVLHPAMNPHDRIFVSSGSDDIDGTVQFLRKNVLSPKVMDYKDHDKLMARTQGKCALMCLDDLEELKAYAEAGDLPPSGTELIIPLAKSREASWTGPTLDAIFGNPELLDIVEGWAEMLRKHQGR